MQHPERDGGELVHRDLEQFLARVGLQDLGQVLAVVAVGVHAGPLQHLGHLAPQHRDPGDALVVGVVGVQAEEAVLADHLAGVVEPLDRDVVEVAAPVHGGPRVGLGEDQPLRVLGPGPHLGRERRERGRPALVVPQDAQAGPGHRHQRHPLVAFDQVVLAVAEEREVVVGEPAQQRLGLGGGPGALGRQPVRQPQPPPRPSSGSPPRPPARRAGPAAGPAPVRPGTRPRRCRSRYASTTRRSRRDRAWPRSSGPTTSRSVPVSPGGPATADG